MKNWARSGVYTFIFIILLLIMLFFLYQYQIKDLILKDYSIYTGSDTVINLNNEALNEHNRIYYNDEVDDIKELYLTVIENKSKHGSFTEYTTQFYETDDNEAYDVFFADGEKGLLDNGTFLREPNAEVKLKGKKPFDDVQKSFTIELYDKEGLWHGQNTIKLEKYENDPLRIRSKLSFDIFRSTHNLLSLRTKFVRLYIKDLNAGDNPEFVDYGLYIQIEDLDKLYFKNRNLDFNGYLYEAKDFYFQDKKGNDLKKDNKINVRGDKDMTQLNQLINDINNDMNDTAEIINYYFDKEYLFDWISTNILIGNRKFASSDHFLYRPLNSAKWYFIPSEFDNTFGRKTDVPNWERGIGILYTNKLYNRILKDDVLRKELIENTKEMYTSKLNSNLTKDILEKYYDEFFNNITVVPDIKFLKLEYDTFFDEYFKLADYHETAYNYFIDSMNYPTPFNVVSTSNLDGSLTLTWDDSFTLDNQDITYNIIVTSDKALQNIIIQETAFTGNKYIISGLSPGNYYFKITSQSANGYIQEMTDRFTDEFGDTYYGVENFTITAPAGSN